jgi:hypothetical protein
MVVAGVREMCDACFVCKLILTTFMGCPGVAPIGGRGTSTAWYPPNKRNKKAKDTFVVQ